MEQETGNRDRGSGNKSNKKYGLWRIKILVVLHCLIPITGLGGETVMILGTEGPFLCALRDILRAYWLLEGIGGFWTAGR